MQEILAKAADWVRDGRSFAMATVVATSGSAPRDVGASMIVSADGEAFGNVSGGCVEGAVYGTALEVIADGAARIERFGYSDADAFAIGLTCGGEVEVLVRPVPAGSDAARDVALLAERASAGMPTRLVFTAAGRMFVGDADEVGVVVDVVAPPRLVIVGAVEFAVALSALAQAAGMRVTVVDARSVFATADRFPGAEVIVDRPGRYLEAQRLGAHDAVCVLTHDAKFDVPALSAALAAPVGYVGAMGSRRTHDDRLGRLREAGVTDAALSRLRSPIGLDLGGRTPAETAVSILAEIVADRHGGSGTRLSTQTGPIHAAAACAMPAASVR
ncbi:XdhC family protein [Microbacterium dauci]|uniref:XdhC family protein n=1 Tax=Microbacterium dauci TaxID=3048008 RepID=A0ABT6ZCS9_9MICO|nr:XdhC family protein [Microbacterium sp. LX3-4]MDJ1113959.1 XdhC family protein [Microbacterium sp. LX3-4]